MTRSYLTKTQMKAGRQFPSFTTKELKSHLRNELTEEMRSRIETEISARESEKRNINFNRTSHREFVAKYGGKK